MSTRRSFSLGKALSAAVTGVPAAWGGAWLSLLLLWLAVAAWPMIFLHFLGAPYGKVPALAWVALMWLLKLVVIGALYRTFIFDRTASAEGRGPGGLQFGAPEVRLLFATLIIALFTAMVVIAGLFVLAIAFDFSGLANGYNSSLAGWHAALMRHHTVVDWTFIVLPLLLLIFLVFLAMKLVLAPVATVAEKRMVTLNAMGLSAGSVGKLFLGVVVLALPFVSVGIFAMHHLSHPVMERPVAMSAAMAGRMRMHLLLHAGIAALAVGLLLPLQTGFLAAAYRQIVALRVK
jgi:hypothetical protein